MFAAVGAMVALGAFFAFRLFVSDAGRAADAGGLRMVELLPIPSDRAAAAPAVVDSNSGDLNARPGEAVDAPMPIVPGGPTLESAVAQVADRIEEASFVAPAEDCQATFDQSVSLSPAGVAAEYLCPAGAVRAPAEGRVLMVVSEPGLEPVEIANTRRTNWQWSRGLELGRFIVIDHGSVGTKDSVISVYSRLGSVDPELSPGDWVGAEVEIATLRTQPNVDPTAPQAPEHAAGFTWEVWLDNEFTAPTYEVSTDTALGWAEQLAAISVPPVDTVCRYPAGSSDLLPNAPRYYRSGVHQGVDFNCGRGHDAFAFADGQVVLLVDDFDNPTVAQREQVLANAGRAGSTPHWILAMLYGNVVVIDHGDVPGVGRVTTISAHLDSVDPAIALGQPVTAGQRLGEIGNAGTNAGSLGSDATLHLHWEVLVDGTHLANGLRSSDTATIYRAMLCDEPHLLDGC